MWTYQSGSATITHFFSISASKCYGRDTGCKTSAQTFIFVILFKDWRGLEVNEEKVLIEYESLATVLSRVFYRMEKGFLIAILWCCEVGMIFGNPTEYAMWNHQKTA